MYYTSTSAHTRLDSLKEDVGDLTHDRIVYEKRQRKTNRDDSIFENMWKIIFIKNRKQEVT